MMDATDMKFLASHLADEMRLSEADQRNRDRFKAACAAMQGMLAGDGVANIEGYAESAVKLADALLAELEKRDEV